MSPIEAAWVVLGSMALLFGVVWSIYVIVQDSREDKEARQLLESAKRALLENSEYLRRD